MRTYLAWSSAPIPDLQGVPGPWVELRPLADGLVAVESDVTLSVVYHQLKAELPSGAALLVTPLDHRPKLKGLAPGSATWFRERLDP